MEATSRAVRVPRSPMAMPMSAPDAGCFRLGDGGPHTFAHRILERQKPEEAIVVARLAAGPLAEPLARASQHFVPARAQFRRREPAQGEDRLRSPLGCRDDAIALAQNGGFTPPILREGEGCKAHVSRHARARKHCRIERVTASRPRRLRGDAPKLGCRDPVRGKNVG